MMFVEPSVPMVFTISYPGPSIMVFDFIVVTGFVVVIGNVVEDKSSMQITIGVIAEISVMDMVENAVYEIS
jgi:hypothetical protein